MIVHLFGELIDVLYEHSIKTDMLCNTQKSVCMVINPRDRNKIVCTTYPKFILESLPLQFVSEFKYLGHMITNDLSEDNDIQREVRKLTFLQDDSHNVRYLSK